MRKFIKKLQVENITTLTNYEINKLEVGDEVVKLTSNQKHTYTVSYKENNVGMCLTYVDASVSETVSYDCVEGNWIYNSTDVTELGGGGGTTYQAGTGIDITDDTISVDTDVISPKLYTHNIDLTFLDGCDETKNIIFRVISSSESVYNATSFKTLFNIGPSGQEKFCGLFNNALIETSETDLPYAFGDLSYYDEADNFRFANNVGNSNYDVSNLTLQTITDNPVEM